MSRTITTFKQARPPMRLKYSWADVCRMRAMHQGASSIAEIAQAFGANKHYVRQIVHGESRPTEDSATRHSVPIVAPKNYPEEFLYSPEGQQWKRRGRGPGRLKPVIPLLPFRGIEE